MKLNKFTYDSSPSLRASRSVFDMSHTVSSHLMHGDLRLVDCIEVLPGDDIELSVPLLNRMSTPIAPIMGNITQQIFAFFVPLRLVWEHSEEFFGANKDSFGIQTKNYTIPGFAVENVYKFCDSDFAFLTDDDHDYTDNVNAVGYEFGLPYKINADLRNHSGYNFTINELPLRSYCLIWNEYFRDENLCDPFIISYGDNTSGEIDITRGGQPFSYSSEPIYVCKRRDRFASALPFAQKGSAVAVPVGGLAPVKTAPYDLGQNNTFNPIIFNTSYDTGTAVGPRHLLLDSEGKTTINENDSAITDGGEHITPVNLYTDLSVATGATVNQLRLAFQTQRYLELLARGGTRYVEYLNAVFGVSNGDARLQRPEFLGGVSVRLNIDQIMSTAGYENGDTTKLGSVGAFSVTGDKGEKLAVKGFTEHGYILILTCARHERSYCEGFDPMLLKNKTLDIYNPAFAHIGEVGVKTIELCASDWNNKGLYRTDKNSVFGFQPAWNEYRHLLNKTCGYLNPNIPNSLDYWTLAEKDVPYLLNETFIKEDRNALSRCLSTGKTGPDYICSYYISLKMRREMPVHSIPGLIDHI